MFGLISINKPTGVTSRYVVDRVQRLARPNKVGHAGTLDPLATGLLVVCVGPATRLVPYLHQLSKSYVGTFLLGRTSPTDDVEGEIIEFSSAPVPSLEQIRSTSAGMVGTIEQRPPNYSAIKVGGRRAYALARAGESFDLASRRVTVSRLEVLEYAYPELKLSIECSSGTYVRALGRDLAERLGTGAIMSGLVRTSIGPLRVEEAVDLEDVGQDRLPAILQNPLAALPHLPKIQLETAEVEYVLHGRMIVKDVNDTGTEVCGVDGQGNLVAILRPLADGTLKPVRCFAS